VEFPLACFHLFPVSAQHDVIIACSTATLHSMMQLLLGNQAV